MMSYMMKSNYKFAGVLMVYAFYYYLNHMEKKSYIQRLGMLLAMYTGELGFYSKKFKRVYKVFYPVHLFIMGVIFHLMLYGGIIE